MIVGGRWFEGRAGEWVGIDAGAGAGAMWGMDRSG